MHKYDLYYSHSCGSLPHYARKAQITLSHVTVSTETAALTRPPIVEMLPGPPPTVTLAVNAQNLALLTAVPLLTESIKQVAQFVGKLLALAPQAINLAKRAANHFSVCEIG